MMDLVQFIQLAPAVGLKSSAWTRYEDAEVYARKTPLPHAGRLHFVVANMTRATRSHNVHCDVTAKSTGFLDRFLSTVESEAARRKFDAVRFENVLNDFLGASLAKRGYVNVNEEWRPPTYQKDLHNSVEEKEGV